MSPVEVVTPSPAVAPWNRTEESYVESYMASLVRRYERGIEFEKGELEKLGPKATKAREKAELSIRFWGEVLSDLRNPASRKYQGEVESAKGQYAQVVRKAISTGKDVAEDIINSRLEFRTAKTARERYEKGRHTSFANRSIAINEQMRHEQGFKVKRQDGKPITPEQIKEISDGVAEIEGILGPLYDLFEKTDITIAHTSGKHPFLTGYGGLYSIHERTVTMGAAGVKALAHEIAHWLDNEAGHVMGVTGRVYNKSGKSAETTSLADKSDRGVDGYSLIVKARASMTDTYKVRRLFKTGSAESEEPKLATVKAHLGAYWDRGSEIWARLVEQYVATKIGRRSEAADSPQMYEETPGWWSKAEFAKLMPEVEAEIKKRVRELRGSDVVPPRHQVTPPTDVVKQADEVAAALKDDMPDREWEEYLETLGKSAAANTEKRYSLRELQRLQSYRGLRSVQQDVAHTARVIYPMRQARKWLKAQNRSDIIGVDAKPRLSR